MATEREAETGRWDTASWSRYVTSWSGDTVAADKYTMIPTCSEQRRKEQPLLHCHHHGGKPRPFKARDWNVWIYDFIAGGVPPWNFAEENCIDRDTDFRRGYWTAYKHVTCRLMNQCSSTTLSYITTDTITALSLTVQVITSVM